MVYDTIRNARLYSCLGERFARAFQWLRESRLNELPEGRYEIDGTDVYATVIEQRLKPWAEGAWEAHRKYADIQAVIRGKECFGFSPAEGMTVATPYDEEKDFALYAGEAAGKAELTAGEMMVFFPQDAHRPGILPADGDADNRKVVVKVRL